MSADKLATPFVMAVWNFVGLHYWAGWPIVASITTAAAAAVLWRCGSWLVFDRTHQNQ